jgi:hypothetical protein
LPVDIPVTPNLTWIVTEPVAGAAEIDGFTATTLRERDGAGRLHGAGHAAIAYCRGGATGTLGATATESTQVLIGALPTPKFLARVRVVLASPRRPSLTMPRTVLIT